MLKVVQLNIFYSHMPSCFCVVEKFMPTSCSELVVAIFASLGKIVVLQTPKNDYFFNGRIDQDLRRFTNFFLIKMDSSFP